MLLNGWATWCVECRTELPAIQRLAETYRDRGLQVIGVNVDEGGDGGPIAFAAQRGLTFAMVHDEHTRCQASFRAVGVPRTELISARGRLLKVWQGVFDPTDPARGPDRSPTSRPARCGDAMNVLAVVVAGTPGAEVQSLGDLLRQHQDQLTRVFGALTILLGLALHRSMAAFAVVKRHYRAVMMIGGGLLVATGVLEITGLWNSAVQHLQTVLPGSTIL